MTMAPAQRAMWPGARPLFWVARRVRLVTIVLAVVAVAAFLWVVHRSRLFAPLEAQFSVAGLNAGEILATFVLIQLGLSIAAVRRLRQQRHALWQRLHEEQQLREHREEYHLVFEQHPEPMWMFDAETLTVLDVNDAAVARYGYSRSDFLVMSLAELWPDGGSLPLASLIGDGEARTNLRTRHQLKDGRAIFVDLTTSSVRYLGRPARMAMAQNVTDRVAMEDELTRIAFTDPLTGLANRGYFNERLQEALSENAAGRVVGLMFIDLDRFKHINDSLGHAAGDRLLVEVARRLRSCLRPTDDLARLGGDEFTVLLPNLPDIGPAVAAAERMLAALREPVSLAGHELIITPSIGITTGTERDSDASDMLREADLALYRAKASGRNQYMTYSPAMSEQAMERLDLEGDLRRAVARGQMRVLYQPLLDLQTGELAGVEALMRWQHPWRGLLAPSEFIALAEETGVIIQLGEWMFTQACRQVRQWQQAAGAGRLPLRMGVNLTAREFQHEGLAASLLRIARHEGIAPSSLCIEITESIAMQDADGVVATLRSLKDSGFHLAIDDFGTGYSSLGYLRRFPLDTIKIDRLFVQDVEREPSSRAIIEAVARLAHALGMKVTAEGIETTGQQRAVRALGCDLGQGYLFGRPVTAEELAPLLEHGGLDNPVVRAA